MPDAVLIAGANGAGKTTFARHYIPVAFPDAVFLNADEIQREGGALVSPLSAGRELVHRLGAAVASRRDFVIETTLSSRQYARRIPGWRDREYIVTLIFLQVPSADFAVDRVAMRVSMGGHNVPETDIRRRFARGLALFRDMYMPMADVWYWYQWNGQAYEIYQQSPKAP